MAWAMHIGFSGQGNMAATTAYKILTGPEMAALERDGSFAGAPIDLTDGYIHLSTAEQLDETAAKHFAGQTDLHIKLCDRWQDAAIVFLSRDIEATAEQLCFIVFTGNFNIVLQFGQNTDQCGLFIVFDRDTGSIIPARDF